MAEASKDYFGTYLSELEKQSSSMGTSGTQEGLGLPMRVLGVLAEEHPIPLRDLQAKTALELDEFSRVLKVLRDAGYVEVSGEPGSEVAEITIEGIKVAGVATS